MNIPSQQQCYRLIEEMGMLAHIVAHSEKVCRVALCLGRHIGRIGIQLNQDLIRAAAMLHDITKTRSFETKENHAFTGAQYLTERGYPEVGRIVGQHVRLDRYFDSRVPQEAEIVNYADKRVLHDQIASLSARMGYILERYGNNNNNKHQIMNLWQQSEFLEARLFACLPFPPAQLEQMVDSDPFD